MTLQDLFITPIFLVLLTLGAYWIRPYVTNASTKKYFLPALYVKFGAAIMLGLIYQFYYGGGDTFNYFTYGSRYIWQAFLDNPLQGISILLESGGQRVGTTFEYTQHIWYYRDENSFFIVRIAGLFDLFTFHTYSATALFFAVFSFSGLWAMYSALNHKYRREQHLAIAILFVPTVVFWGSGILKDTITLGAVGWLTWSLFHIIELKNTNLAKFLIAFIAVWIIYSIKSYIVICYVPVVFIWLYFNYQRKVKSTMLKVLVAPFLIGVFGLIGYLATIQIGDLSDKYSLDTIAEQAAITAYDIRYGWGARTGGDGGYDIGIPDGTWLGMIRLMPAAVNVSLFRPYLWEVRNPLMLLSALESFIVLILTIRMIYLGKLRYIFSDPFLVFCLVFSLLFAFAVGVSTFNFGTLMRYKIPMMPFFVMVLLLSDKKHQQSRTSLLDLK